MFLDANIMGITIGQQGIKNKNLSCSFSLWAGLCGCLFRRVIGLANDNDCRWFITEAKTILGGKTKRFWFPIRVHNPEVNIPKSISALELEFLRLSYACRRLVYMPLNRVLVEIILHRISIVSYWLRLFGLINFAISPYFC
jgi:hypothetical protein